MEKDRSLRYIFSIITYFIQNKYNLNNKYKIIKASITRIRKIYLLFTFFFFFKKKKKKKKKI